MRDDEFTDKVRSMIEHENTMRDQRLHWLIASQGILIAALGFSWNIDVPLVIAISVVGFLLCVSVGASLYCNTLAIRSLVTIWERRLSDGKYEGPGVIALRSSDVAPSIVTKIYPWNVIPITLSAFWIVVVGYKLLG